MILLDTHTFLWFVNDPAQLPSQVNQLIEEAETVYISIASFWDLHQCTRSSVQEVYCYYHPELTRNSRTVMSTSRVVLS